MIDITFALYYGVLGIPVGFIAGLVGVGGGGLTVPAFTLLFTAQGVAGTEVVHMALGTSMAAMVFTTFSSMKAHFRKGHVKTSVATRMSIGVMAGTLIATTIAAAVNGIYLALFFSLFMFYVACKMFLKTSYKPNPKPHTSVGLVTVGSLSGTVSALVSVSGAGLVVPYLMGQNFNVKQAVGTSAAIGFPLTVSGTLGYLINGWQHTSFEQLTLGYIYLPAVALFSLTSYFAAPLGVSLASRLPASNLKKVLGVLSLMLSLKMLMHVLEGAGIF